MQIKRYLLVDGKNILYRLYWTEKTPRLVGLFFREIIKTDRMLSMTGDGFDDVVLCWDSHLSVRKELFPCYKISRPDDAVKMIINKAQSLIHKIAYYAGLPTYLVEGYEADDIIGTIACGIRYIEDEAELYILSGDSDLYGLINNHITCIKSGRLITGRDVVAKFGVVPEQIWLYKALVGDVSDDLPGVMDIGAKRALGIISNFTTPGQLVKDGEGKWAEHVKDHADMLALMFKLVKPMFITAPVPFSPSPYPDIAIRTVEEEVNNPSFILDYIENIGRRRQDAKRNILRRSFAALDYVQQSSEG